MAFTVETGAGLSTSNAYIDTSFADDYHADRGHTAWALQSDGTTATTLQDRQTAIVRATDHVDRVFGRFFRGERVTSTQSLHWPRLNAWDDSGYLMSGVPLLLQRAISEYALRALLLGVLTPDLPSLSPGQTLTAGASNPSYGDAVGELTLERNKIGPLEEEKRFATGVNAGDAKSPYAGALPRHPAADLMILGLLENNSGRIYRG